MTCVIIDDEPHAIDVLKRYVEQTDTLQLLGTFRIPLKALSIIHEKKPELIFLDINMPGINGIQFLQSLTYKPQVIFTTAYSEYGAESYNWEVTDYLLKPILLERFLKAVHRAKDLARKRNSPEDDRRVVLLKSGGQVYPVNISDIFSITKESNYLEVHTTERTILIRANMNEIFDIFPEQLFCRIHKSHVVAIRHVKMIDAHTVEVNKIKLPLSANYREELNKRIHLAHS